MPLGDPIQDLPGQGQCVQGEKVIVRAPDSQRAAGVAVDVVRPGDVVLVKASRGVKAEAVVDALVARLGMAEVS